MIRQKKSLGQYFLSDPSIVKRIIDAAHLNDKDTVVEIGPGPGVMTGMLAKRVKRVIAIEIDEDILKKAMDSLSGRSNIEFVLSDALIYDYDSIGTPFKVVANIPYYITTPLIFRLLDSKDILSMTLTLQKEVARRIVASPNNKDYGVLSIACQFYTAPSLCLTIPKGAFRPVPKVDSAAVYFEVLKKPSVDVPSKEMFFRIVRTAFSQRRKMLLNSLKALGLGQRLREVLDNAGIDPSRRPETLSLDEFAVIARLLG